MNVEFTSEYRKEAAHTENLGVEGGVKLKYVMCLGFHKIPEVFCMCQGRHCSVKFKNKWYMTVCTGLIWLKKVFGGGFVSAL
jgi:hypothetical protein